MAGSQDPAVFVLEGKGDLGYSRPRLDILVSECNSLLQGAVGLSICESAIANLGVRQRICGARGDVNSLMDTLTTAERSAQMSKVRSSDTKPEMRVRRLVHSMGY